MLPAPLKYQSALCIWGTASLDTMFPTQTSGHIFFLIRKRGLEVPQWEMCQTNKLHSKCKQALPCLHLKASCCLLAVVSANLWFEEEKRNRKEAGARADAPEMSMALHHSLNEKSRQFLKWISLIKINSLWTEKHILKMRSGSEVEHMYTTE